MVLFCVKADFNGDEVCLSFCGDNGVRSVLLNASILYPLVQVRELQEFYTASKYQQKDVETMSYAISENTAPVAHYDF